MKLRNQSCQLILGHYNLHLVTAKILLGDRKILLGRKKKSP